MKISYNWLSELAQLTLKPQELAERFETINQPLRRRPDLNMANDARRVTRAERGIVNLNRSG